MLRKGLRAISSEGSAPDRAAIAAFGTGSDEEDHSRGEK